MFARNWITVQHSGNMTGMSGFSEWVKQQLELRHEQDVADAARALGIRPSELGRWLSAKRPPTQDTIRTACRIFDVHVQEVLVAAGYMTPEESGLDGKPVSLSELSTRDLLDELARRTTDLTTHTDELQTE